MISLVGTWLYTEDFSHGDSEGVLEISQSTKQIKAILIHTETPLNEKPFTVTQELIGEYIASTKTIYLKAINAKLSVPTQDLVYELDSFEAKLINDNLMVGTSEDNQGIIGVFSFKRQL